MEYQKIINLLDDATNQPTTFRTRNWVEWMMNQKRSVIIVISDFKRPW